MTDKKSGFIVLHYGSMSPEAMSKAIDLVGEDAIMSTDAARMSDASFAFGEPNLLDALKERLAPAVAADTQVKYAHLSSEAKVWLAFGEQGLSSKAMFAHILDADLELCDATAHPYDPADLRRCRLLKEAVPEIDKGFQKLASLSDTWARFVDQWDELCALMDAESPNWRKGEGRAHDTYAKIQCLLASPEADAEKTA